MAAGIKGQGQDALRIDDFSFLLYREIIQGKKIQGPDTLNLIYTRTIGCNMDSEEFLNIFFLKELERFNSKLLVKDVYGVEEYGTVWILEGWLKNKFGSKNI